MFLFAVGLMCKPMLITMPVVLLLLDYWPLQRKETAARLIKEKLPLLVLSAAVCVATVLAQVGTIGAFESYSMPLRLANALVSCVVYLGQMIWPVGLAAFYPYPHYGLPAREVALSAVLLAGLSLVAVWQCRKRRWLLVGWAWYLVMLLPVLGIIQVGAQAHADRYTYLPQIGVCVAITWLVAELRLSRAALVGLGAGVLGLFMFCAWQQTGYWQDSDTLWSYTLACTTDNDVSQNNLGIVLLRKGKIDAAMACFQRALQIRPSSAEARNNLGLALMQEGKLDAAVTSFHQALETRPDFAEAYDNLGYSLLQMGKTDDAITQCRHALQISPDDAQACVNLGNAFVQKGRVADAIAQYRKALEINPGLTTARKNLDSVLLQNAPR
jgi:Flp pilus assembly protein TadD